MLAFALPNNSSFAKINTDLNKYRAVSWTKKYDHFEYDSSLRFLRLFFLIKIKNSLYEYVNYLFLAIFQSRKMRLPKIIKSYVKKNLSSPSAGLFRILELSFFQ